MDNPSQVALLVKQALTEGILSMWWVTLLLFVSSAIGAGVGVWAGSYLKRKGENLATREDFKDLLEQLNQTTRVTEDIKGQHAQIIAKMHVNATVLSRNRQEWINTLREQIAEFLSLVEMVNMAGQIGMAYTNEYLLPKVERALFLQSKITLLINPGEADHVKLVKLIGDATAQMITKKVPFGEWQGEIFKISKEIKGTAQTILKREWERVKVGE